MSYEVNGRVIEPGADLYGAFLPRADLSGVELMGASLQHADLQDADLEHADLYGADIQDADLRGARLQDANLTYAKLDRADLQDADLERAKLYRASLCYADLRGANLRDADLYGADLEGANLTGANLTGANLTGANLTGADLKDSTITHKQIKSADGGCIVKIGKTHKEVIPTLLEEISFRVDTEVKETPENKDRIIARLEQLSSDVAHLAGISKQETPAKTVLAAIEASNLTPEIMELVSDAVLDCADME